MSNKKGLLLAIGVVLLGLIITAGSYAFWSWNSNPNKSVAFNTSKALRNYIVYNEGESKFVGDFKVGSNYQDNSIHSTISLYKTADAANVTLMATIHLDVNSIGENMKKSNALKWVVTKGNSTNPGEVLAQGNFVGTNNGDTLTLVPNIEVTTTNTEYTVWIWLDRNANPSDALSGETLDTNVWTEINQLEGVEDRFEITRLSANYQNINATVVDSKAKVTHYAVVAKGATPSTWTSVGTATNIYNLNTTVDATGEYDVYFKDELGKTTHKTIKVTAIDNTAPNCTFGSWSVTPIANNETSDIELTCTDNESEITVNNLKTTDITKSNSNITITNIKKVSISNGYKYTITVKGTETDGTSKLTLPVAKVKNAMALGNAEVSSATITVANKYTVVYQSGNNNCELNTTTYANKTATYGTAYSVANPTCTGYTFDGWTANSGLDTTNAKYGNSSSSVTTTWSNANTKVKATWFNNLALRTVKTVTLTANWTANDLTFNNQTLNTGTYGTAYTSNAFTGASNGTGSYTYAIKSGAPSGATLSNDRKISFTNTTPAGTYNVVVMATDTVNNKTKDATMKIVINPKAITITAKDQSITYGGSIATGTSQVTVATLASGDTLSAITLKPSTSNATTNGKITPSAATIKKGTTDVTSSYTITYVDGKLTISAKQLTVPSSPSAKTYTGSSQGSGITCPSGSTASGTQSAIDAGTFTQTCTLSSTSNYVWSDGTTTAKDITWKINPKSIAVSWGTVTWTYDGSAHSTTASAATGISAETMTLSISNNSITYKGTQAVSATCASVAGGQKKCENYTLTGTSKTLTINAKAITITAKEVTKAIGKKGLDITAYSTAWVNNATTYSRNGYATGVGSETINLTYTPYTNAIGSYSYATSGASGKFTLSQTNSNYSISSAGNLTLTDSVSPTVQDIAGGTTLKATSQTLTLKCTDNVGVTAYYWGTTNPNTADKITTTTAADLTALQGSGLTKTVTAAGTYYLGCKDAAGNIASKSIIIRKYQVQNVLETIAGTTGTYTSANYENSGSAATYYVKNGTSLTLASIYSIPTGAASGTFKGYTTSAPGTSAASPSTTAPTVATNDTTVYYMWFDRNTYKVTASKPTNGTVMIETVTQASNSVTASTAAAELTVKYGDMVKATATPSVGYSFTSWSGGYVSGTTNPSTGAAVTAAKTITASFSINTYTITYDLADGNVATANPTSYNINTSTITLNNPTKTGYTFDGWTEQIVNLSWNDGFIDQTTGVINTNSSYPDSNYSDFIRLKGGVKYTISGLGDYDTAHVRWRAYYLDGTYKGSAGSGTNAYIYTPTQDFYVRVLLYDGLTNEQMTNAVVTANTKLTTQTIPQGYIGNRKYTASYNINNPTTPTISGGATKVANISATTLTCATTTTYSDGASLQYSFGYTTTENAEINSSNYTWDSYSTSNTRTIAKAAFRQIRYYACRVKVSDGTNTSDEVYSTTTTTMALVNARINLDATTNGGTASETTKYVPYGTASIYNERTTTTNKGTFPVATKNGYTFDGWYTDATDGSKVVDSNGEVQANVSNWTNANKYWLLKNATDNSTVNKLYAHFVDITPPTGSITTSIGSNTVTATVTVSDTGSGPKSSYGWKVSTDSTCDSSTTGFVDSNSNTYNFNITSIGIHYICVRIEDNAGNNNYVSKVAETSYIDYEYTGDYQPFTVPVSGYYKLETWGAQGGTVSTGIGGKGGNSSGYIYLNEGEKLYIYVGEKVTSYADKISFNGGGRGSVATVSQGTMGANGGGATDIRYFGSETPSTDDLVWNSTKGLNSRIMVAAGGGGGTHWIDDTYASVGGSGGGLIGASGSQKTIGGSTNNSSGGTQTVGGTQANSSNNIAQLNGSFGQGGSSNTYTSDYVYQSGGGGGYYGGGAGNAASNVVGSASGGSSFISGYAGVNAITSSSNRTHTATVKHYSNKYFINGEMQAGVNSGNGKAKITYYGPNEPTRINGNLNNVRYIKDCANGSSANVGNFWGEFQAIKNGVNLTKGKAVSGTSPQMNDSNWSYTYITDGLIDNITTGSGLGHASVYGYGCVTIDLGNTYDLDEIAVWHYFDDGRTFYDNVTYTSSDNSTWHEVIRNGDAETSNGKRVNAWNFNIQDVYTVTYHGNGGDGGEWGDTWSNTATYNQDYVTPKNWYTRTGYTFNGWNEKADGTGTAWTLTSAGVYENGNGANKWKWTYTNNIDLYAQWVPLTYTVTYSCGTGSGTAPSSQTVQYGNTIHIQNGAGNCSKTGHTFSNWTSPGYNGTGTANWNNWEGTWQYINGLYGISNNTLSLTASWTPITYTIQYSCGAGTGTAPSNQTVVYNNSVTIQSGAGGCTKYGGKFLNWTSPGYNGTGSSNWAGYAVNNWTYINGQYGITNNTLTLTATWKTGVQIPQSFLYQFGGGCSNSACQHYTGDTMTNYSCEYMNGSNWCFPV